MHKRTSQAWTSRHVVRNSAGYRDNIEYSKKIPDGKIRITLLGDSFTVGQGIKDVEKRFSNELRENNPNWDVQLMAKSGWNTKDQVYAINQAIYKKYEFNYVILIYCLNDIEDLDSALMAKNKDLSLKLISSNCFVRNSYFLDHLFFSYKLSQLDQNKDYFTTIAETYSSHLWKQQKERLDLLRLLIKKAKGKLIVITFPFMLSEKRDAEFIPAYRNLDAYWKKNHIPNLNIKHFFSNYENQDLIINQEDHHPNELANTLFYNSALGFVEKEILRHGN